MVRRGSRHWIWWRAPAMLAFAVAAGSLGIASAPVRAATTFTVHTTGDEPDLNLANSRCDVSSAIGDQCTLRAAIQEANDTAGPDIIVFDIVSTTATKTIAPASPLPTITDTVTINGYSQRGSSTNTLATGNNAVLRIVLNGANAGTDRNGLEIEASDSVVRGLVINRFSGDGIVVVGSNNQVKGNFIGTNASGNVALSNAMGVNVIGPDNLIGGTAPAARNLLSGNRARGVYLSGPNAFSNTVQGNYIGTRKGGANALGNGSYGVEIRGAPGNVIGGTDPGTRNVISGNGRSGVVVRELDRGGGPSILGNFIGTDATGTADLGNGEHGIHLASSSNGTVGGTTAGAGNVISGNGLNGVTVHGSGNGVQGNHIGTDVTGTAALGNDDNGVVVSMGRNLIGGTASGAGNVISGNGQSGIHLVGDDPDGNLIQGNRIGTRADGTGDLGNVLSGVVVNAPETLIGGTGSASNLIFGNGLNGVQIDGSSATGNEVRGNVIRENGAVGVRIASGPNSVTSNVIRENASHGVRLSAGAVGVPITGNVIFANGGLGINLAGGTETSGGVTSNDLDDPDTGVNGLQNFPILTSATRSNGNGLTTITGMLNSNPSQTFMISIYMAVVDPSGHGEGQVQIASASVTTNSGGDIGFAAFTTAPVPGQSLTATATNTASQQTSEFALNRVVTAVP